MSSQALSSEMEGADDKTIASPLEHTEDDLLKSKLGGEAHIAEVQGDARYLEAVTTAPLDPWSKTSLQLYGILLIAALNATASGFDGVSPTYLHHRLGRQSDAQQSIFSSINAMSQYQAYFHHTELGSSTGMSVSAQTAA